MPLFSEHLSVLTLVYQRAFALRAIFDNLYAVRLARRGQPITWFVALSPRVSTEVVSTISDIQREQLATNRGPRIELLQAPFSPLGVTERFMELRQWQLSFAPPGWAILWDDDQCLANPGELAGHLDPSKNTDLVYATKVFFWDSDEQVATHLPTHRSVFLFRRREGDVFDLGRTLHAPVGVHDAPREVADLKGALLDYGYMRQEDRARCWSEYKKVGKLDAATFPLIQEPTLQSWSGPFPLRHRHAR